jgi:5-hydroxyisourate hydrolase
MAGKLSTHVLDTASGKPAAGVRVELHLLDGTPGKSPIADVVTNADGRAMLIEPGHLTIGRYRLLFHVGDYFTAAGVDGARRFLDVVPVLFAVDDPSAGYHVPLLVSPWAYSTYRGS